MDDIVIYLKSLPKELLLLIVYRLMQDGNITYHELIDMHVQHLKELEQGTSDKLMELQSKVMLMWADKKCNYGKNLKDIMHYLCDEGRVNLTHEQIDKK